MAKVFKQENVTGIDCLNGSVDIVAMLDQADADGWRLIHILSYPELNYVMFIWDKGV